MLNKTVTLNNGVNIPVIGLGTWQTPDDVAADAVRQAIEVGYRHIDTAAAYCNERGVGRGIKQSGLPRDKIFVTSKIPAEYKTYRKAVDTLDESLRLLDTDYIDLMLIHAPRPWDEMADANARSYNEENAEVYRALTEAYCGGKVRAIGVSNFSPDDIKNLTDRFDVVPAVNQISFFIGRNPSVTVNYCRESGILTEAYSPIATGALLHDGRIAAVAARYGVSVPQLCIKYVLQMGAIALPKTVHREYMEQNARLDFEIAPEDMIMLQNM